MSDARVVGSRVYTPVTEDRFISPRALREGTQSMTDFIQAMIIGGRGHMLQLGDEDSPIASTTSIADTLVSAVVDIPEGFSMIPFFAQAVVATWTTSTLLNFMIEIDNSKVRYTSGGTAFVPLPLRNGAGIPIATQASDIVVGPDITTAAKTALGSKEIFRESIEVNWGNAGDGIQPFVYEPKIYDIVDGPASVLYHFGAATADVTFYGNMKWIEFPTDDI